MRQVRLEDIVRVRSGLSESMHNGWRVVTLSSGLIEVTVLPDKGADICALTDLTSGVDPLFKAPWGLQPPGSPPREGSAGEAFLANYEGAWQELFPNTNDACAYRGAELPFHGEVATLPWSWSWSAEAGEDAVAVRLSVDCRRTPFRLERLMRLPHGERALVLEESVRNTSAEPAHFVWGHHCVLGPPLVAAGAELRVPCRTIVTIGERLAPRGADRLPWELLDRAAGAYFTAGDEGALSRARRSGVVVASPRGREALEKAHEPIDALVYSGLDADETAWARRLADRARFLVETRGALGGVWRGESEGSWEAVPPAGPPRDSYGCGDSFAAAFTYGLAAGQSVAEAAALGAQGGARRRNQPGAP